MTSDLWLIFPEKEKKLFLSSAGVRWKVEKPVKNTVITADTRMESWDLLTTRASRQDRWSRKLISGSISTPSLHENISRKRCRSL